MAAAVTHGGGGIIPARAGFTREVISAVVAAGDHPRSRGVYSAGAAQRRCALGSSPLARGLPTQTPPDRTLVEDHPRSRGVYATGRARAPLPWGSSPLARGLLGDRPGGRSPRGIIPARAGFTWRCRRRAGGPADHPRSRGVYHPMRIRTIKPEGSSPLARGLLAFRFAFRVCVWIIPARAGFTRRSPRPRRGCTDHPRSRGVYARRSTAASSPLGSSPLARGLQINAGSTDRIIRIIPARAGFTLPELGRVGLPRDHPRSRGVYPPCPARRSATGGSSPLARGLHTRPQGPDQRLRIIPARAGFTPSSEPSPWPPRDHPRSRGVYEYEPVDSSTTPGSSPLARGLPPVQGRPDRLLGIIPARAGFTRRCS